MKANHVVVSAPGKVILYGEHAVVYDKPAIAASIGLRTTVTISHSSKQTITLHLQTLNKKLEWSLEELRETFPEIIFSDERRHDDLIPPDPSCLDAINQLIEKHYELEVEPVKDAAKVFLCYIASFMHENKWFLAVDVDVSSNLPIGAGLGSSASYSISLATSMLLAVGSISISSQAKDTNKTHQEQEQGEEGGGYTPESKRARLMASGEYVLLPESLKLVCDWAFEAEKLMHGSPSGIDNTISTYGGALQFLNGEITHLESFPTLQILLVDTKIPRSTGKMVSGLRKRYKEYPSIYAPLFDAVGGITSEGLKILSTLHHQQNMSGNQSSARKISFHKLETLIDMNQQLLAVMGVSHHALDRLCQVTAKYSLHSKLTGAGGGGCAITLISEGTKDDDVSKLCEVLSEEEGFQVWRTTLGSHGLLVHECVTCS